MNDHEMTLETCFINKEEIKEKCRDHVDEIFNVIKKLEPPEAVYSLAACSAVYINLLTNGKENESNIKSFINMLLTVLSECSMNDLMEKVEEVITKSNEYQKDGSSVH